jgi:hypothetical protein
MPPDPLVVEQARAGIREWVRESGRYLREAGGRLDTASRIAGVSALVAGLVAGACAPILAPALVGGRLP